MKKRATIHDVAASAGVTATTVSRVLNDHQYVSEETRARVLEIIKELDYRPRYSARQMRTRTTRLFGLLTDEISTSPYGYDVIKGAQDEAWRCNQMILMMTVGRDKQLIEEAVGELLEREVEGLIYASAIYSPVELPDIVTKLPIVLANCFDKAGRFTSFLADEVTGGYEATKLLLEKGHRRIAFLNLTSGPDRNSSIERLIGYKKALKEYRLPFESELLRYTEHVPLAGYRYTNEFLDSENPPTAFFCGNDRTALECYMALKERRIRISDDISVVGYDNYVDICEHLYPPLTTVAMPQYEIGSYAMKHLLEAIHDEKKLLPRNVLFPCPPIIRGSV